MRDYPVYSAIVFGALILTGWWRARGAPRRIGAAFWVLAAAAAAFAAGESFVAPRARPSLHAVQPGVSVLYHAVSGFPPPSGAAAMAGAVTTGLFFVHARLGIAAAAVAVALAAFQICVIAYAWQDVVAGLVFGVAIAGGGYAALADALARVGGGLVRVGRLRPGTGGRADRERRHPGPPAAPMTPARSRGTPAQPPR
ncbi:MAG TPA: hypothetical protein VKD26_06550 [Streptosporangiaceae bacterium]|nr:hypothetical protein [Streptosporangiaceae bacterium]